MENHHIGLQFKRIHQLIRRMINSQSLKAEIEKVTGTNSWIIGYLGDNRDKVICQRDIEKKFNITRSTTSKILILMEQKGLIERQSVDYDARLKQIVLTPKSLKLVQMMNQDRENVEAQITKGFSEDELKVLENFLARIEKNLTE